MNVYLYYEGIFYEKGESGEVGVFETPDLVKPKSKVIYIPNGFDVIEKRKDLLSYIKENALDEIEEKKILVSKFENKYLISEFEEEFEKKLPVLEEKKVNIISIVDYINDIFSNNTQFFVSKEIDYLLFEPFSNYALYVPVLADDEMGGYKIGENITVTEIRNLIPVDEYIDFSLTRENLLVLSAPKDINRSDEDIKEIIEKFSIFNFNKFNKSKTYKFLKEKLGEYFVLFNLPSQDVFDYVAQKKIETEIIDVEQYVRKIQKENTVRILIIGGIVLLFGIINYFIQGIWINHINEKYENQLEYFQEQYRNLQNREKLIKAKRIVAIIDKKYGKSSKQILVLPYLIEYLSNFNLKVKTAKIVLDPKTGDYIGFITVKGFLPNALINRFGQTIGLNGLDIIPSKDVSTGFDYILSFNLKDSLKKLHLNKEIK